VLSGRDTLEQMDRTLRDARRELDQLDQELSSTSRALSENKLEQARAIERMASIHLDAAKRGELVAKLESSTKEARRILAERDSALAELKNRINEATDRLEQLESDREALNRRVAAAAKQLAEREAAVQKALDEDPGFQEQLERTERADAVAARAAEKADLAEADRDRKGQPYESDELFMYLWRRGYGTAEYSAGPLSRMLDGWVARLCRFEDARSNYWMLLEIPKRLSEHAESAQVAADEALDRLQDIEETAAVSGGVAEAKDTLERLEAEQDAFDLRTVEAEKQLSRHLAEQGRFVSGSDDFMVEALQVFSAALERRAVDELTELAMFTLTREDDSLVENLRQLRHDSDVFQDELRENRERQSSRLERVRELEEVRRNFKQSRYDDIHSRFDKGDLIQQMIGGVVSGMIQGSALWKTIQRYQKYLDMGGEWPDFGSGGFPMPRRRGRRTSGRSKPGRPPSWHWPGPSQSSGGGGFRLPRPPRRSSRGRGGFKTGGGF